MALGITKGYTPSSGDVADSTLYNTDIAALFNAFSGLEAQTSTLGGLTITPTADTTTIFQVNNAAGTELFSLDTTNSYMKLKATARFYLDGGGDTYILENAANNIRIIANAITSATFWSAGMAVEATKKLYLDGGSDTYIFENSANNIRLVTNDATSATFWSDGMAIEATKKIYLDGGTNTYIYENTGDNIRLITNDATAATFWEDGMALEATKKYYVDGGGDTYMYESSANNIRFVANDVASTTIWSAGLAVEATKNIYLDGGGNTYLVESSSDVIDCYVGGVVILSMGTSYGYFPSGTAIGTAHDANHIDDATHGAASTTMYIGNETIDTTAVSDIRKKENIKDTKFSLSDLLKISVKDFNFKEDLHKQVWQGMIAQELINIYPNAVIEPKEGVDEFYRIEYKKLIPLIIKSIQDLYAMVKGEDNGSKDT